MAPFCFPNPPKPIKNLTPRGIKNLIAFGFDFWSMLDPFWEPSWSHVGHLFRPKTAQEASKMLQDASRASKTSLRPSQGTQNHAFSIFGRCWTRFESQVGTMLATFFSPRQPKDVQDSQMHNTNTICTFQKKPACTNTLSKKASLKTKGPAVIAVGVGN